MRSLLLPVLLTTVLVPSSHAGMALVGETKESILYINLDAAEKNGALIKAEGSQDFHQQQHLDGLDYLSAKFVYEFDCSQHQARQLSMHIYPENMANGGALKTDTDVKPWAVPPTGSAQDLMMKKACAKP